MKIKHRFDFVEGDFDTDKGELICSGNKKYGSVDLCFKSNMYITFAPIKLYSSKRAIDADAVYEDALKLGREIARRWNEASPKNEVVTCGLCLYEDAGSPCDKCEGGSEWKAKEETRGAE